MLALLADVLAHDWLNVSAELQGATWTSLLVAALGIPFATVTTGARGIVEAYQDFQAVSLLRLCLGVATFGLPVISVWSLGPSLAWAAAAIVMAMLVAGLFRLAFGDGKLP